MRVAIFVLALVAITASVAYAASDNNEQKEDAQLDALLEKIMKENKNELEDAEMQDDDEDEDQAAELEALLHKVIEQDGNEQKDAEMQADDEDDKKAEAALQEFFAKEQVPAKIQRWFRTRRIRRYVRVRRIYRFGRRVYKAYRCYRG